jgi:hypothetical protein
MRLTSPGGASVELHISGYEFPGYEVHPTDAAVRWLRALTVRESAWAKALPVDLDAKELARDPDANWLRICGNISLADGKTWAFEQPCLTTWDARELGDWLHGVAAGTVPSWSAGPGDGDERLAPAQLEFLEPNLAFSLVERIADRVRIWVHFGMETLPPWLRGAEEPVPYEYFVCLDMSAEELAKAAESWMRELAEFPER